MPPVRSIFNPTNTEVAQLSNNDARSIHPHGEQPKTALWLWVREMTWYLHIHQRSARTNKGKKTLIQSYSRTVSWMVSSCSAGVMFMTATGLENSPQSFDVYTVSQSRSVVTSAENPAPGNSPQSIAELRNGHVANLQELLYQTGSKNGVI